MVDSAINTERQVLGGLHSSLISIASNFLLAVSKCLVGFLGNSFALVADGIESLSDVFSSSAVYFGLRFAIKPPDKDHPYGHGKADPIAAAIVGVAMIAAALGIAVESINLIRTPHKLPQARRAGNALRNRPTTAPVAHEGSERRYNDIKRFNADVPSPQQAACVGVQFRETI